MIRSISIATLLASSLWIVPALADGQELPPIIGEDWSCGAKLAPTPLMTAFFEPSYVFENPASDSGGLPTVLAGALEESVGIKFSMVFVRTDDGWTGYPVQSQAGIQQAYVSQDAMRGVLFSMHDVEGPGHDYVVLATADGFKTLTCGEVPPPDTELGILDYMRILSVELDEKGNGLLRGIVSTFEDERPAECFVATSSDGGANWTQPKRAEPCIDSAVSSLMHVPEDDGPLSWLRASSVP
jgi:hypothetical protein